MKKTNLLLSLVSIFIFVAPMLYASAPIIDTTKTALVLGCTNPMAKNFNPLATKDNGTCVFRDSTSIPVVYGCMNPKAKNFNPFATKDNGTCVFVDSTLIPVVYGCKDSTARNYNPLATVSNHNCIYKTIIHGCTDTLALNYNSKANVNDGSCKYEVKIWGCTDKNAINFNPKANHDNGYCEYKTVITGCMDKTAINYNPSANRDNRSCIFANIDTLGCTDHFALNFNKFAKVDNGSCIYKLVTDTIFGCKDKRAANFNPLATKSDGTCVYDTTNVIGCKSPRALNFNNKAKFDDGKCTFARPGNVVLPKINPNITQLVDTVGKVLAAACNFDYTLPIDTVYIVGAKKLAKDSVELEWAIKQGDLITSVKTNFLFKKQGHSLVYLSLVCNQSAPVDTTTTLSSVRSKVSSISTDLVKGVTVSSVFISKVSTDISVPSTNKYTVTVYPIPAKDQINVSIANAESGNLQLNVYSVDGRRLITTNVTSVAGANQFEINTTSLNSGLHFLTVTKNGATIETLKFSKL